MFSEPIFGESFYDRSDVLALLEKRAQALKGGYRQNIALIGSEFIGKSSIVCQFLNNFKDPCVLPIYVESRRQDLDNFAKRFIFSALYNLLISEGKKPPSELDSALKLCRKSIPKSSESIDRILELCKKENNSAAYQALMDLPVLLKEDTSKPCIVIIDEFQNMDSYRIENIFSVLGKKMMIQKDTMFVFVSSWKSTAKKILSEKLNLLFGNFEMIEIKGFNHSAAKEFLEMRLAGTGLSDKLKSFLYCITNGQPLYLDLIARKLAEDAKIRGASSIDFDFFIQSLSELLFEARGILNQHFASKVIKFSSPKTASYTCIMKGLANNNHRLKDLAKATNKNSNDLSKSLLRLIELDLVVKNGVFYNLSDKLFKIWLKSVFDRKNTCVAQCLAPAKEQFKREFKDMFDSLVRTSEKPSSEHVMELVKSFGNEAVEIDQKVHILPSFSIVDAKDSQDGDVYISARSGKDWVFKVVDREVSENDVLRFSQKYKDTKRPISKKILVALDGSDINARLLAKQEKIWTWDLPSLNMLLELYNKPLLVR